jgi:plasmid maintenance system killer protein
MIRSFGDKHTEALFHDERVRQFEGIARRAKRKLEAVNAASRLEGISLDTGQQSMASDLQMDQWRAARGSDRGLPLRRDGDGTE